MGSRGASTTNRAGSGQVQFGIRQTTAGPYKGKFQQLGNLPVSFIDAQQTKRVSVAEVQAMFEEVPREHLSLQVGGVREGLRLTVTDIAGSSGERGFYRSTAIDPELRDTMVIGTKIPNAPKSEIKQQVRWLVHHEIGHRSQAALGLESSSAWNRSADFVIDSPRLPPSRLGVAVQTIEQGGRRPGETGRDVARRELFAESYSMYVNRRAQLKQQAPELHDFMRDRVFPRGF